MLESRPLPPTLLPVASRAPHKAGQVLAQHQVYALAVQAGNAVLRRAQASGWEAGQAGPGSGACRLADHSAGRALPPSMQQLPLLALSQARANLQQRAQHHHARHG